MVPASARTEADAVDVQGQPAVDKGEKQQDQGSKTEGSLMILLFNPIDCTGGSHRHRSHRAPVTARAGRGARRQQCIPTSDRTLEVIPGYDFAP